jgi:hypothetical protein
MLMVTDLGVFLTVTALVMVESFNGEALFGVILFLISISGAMTASLRRTPNP